MPSTTSVMQCFDRGAKSYDELAQVQQAVGAQLIRHVDNEVRKAESIIDLGCGTGWLLSKCADLNASASLSALDVSSSMLERVAARGVSVELHQADMQATGLPANCVDVVMSSSALQWADIDLVMPEIARIVRPSGTVAIACFLADTLAAWRGLWGVGSGSMPTQAAVLKAAQTAGLTISKATSEAVIQPQSDFRTALSSVRDIGAGANGRTQRGLMSPRALRRIEQGFDHIVAERGSFPMQYQVFYLIAQKAVAHKVEAQTVNL